jgi:hypothetical protein
MMTCRDYIHFATRKSPRGARRLSLLWILALTLGGASVATAQTPAPRLFFSDLDSGPNSGGESVSGFSGAYVTLYGNFLDASQGSSTVTWNGLNCLRVLPATGTYSGWGSTYFWYQRIIVQIGSSCTAGAGSFVVTVSGAASNAIPFTVRTGNIYFVSTSGNDSNTGSSTAPFRTMTHCKQVVAAGATCYVENGVTASSVDNYDSTFDLERGGTSGNPIAFVAYPGATATIGSAGVTYGLRVPNISVSANNVTVAGFSFTPSDEAMNPTNSNNWRIVGNKFQCPNANGQVGCFETNEMTYVKFYGNETTNVGVTRAGKQQHADYLSSDSNHVDFAWNYIHDNRSCRALQVHSSPLGGGGTSDPTGHQQYDLSIHDNLIHDDPCDGINLATIDPSQGKVEIYNNTVYHVGLGPDPSDGEASYNCLYFPQILNTGPAGSGTVEIYNNTFYDCGSHVGTFNLSGVFSFNSGPVSFKLRNNLVNQLSAEYYNNSGTGLSGVTVTGSNNLWFGSRQATPTFTTSNIALDPLFTSLSSFDFTLQSTSPAIDVGTAVASSNSFGGYQVWNGNPLDAHGISRPQGSAYDIGANEYFAGGSTVQKPNPPTNLTVVAQ